MTDAGFQMLEGGSHILVVDDDIEIRDLLARFLRKHGYRVTGARNGREMRESLAATQVDLVVLDLMLPGESGLDLCREARATSLVPIVMLTAMGDDMDRIVGLEMGADDYLPKPFNPRELLARIKAVLRRTTTNSDPVSHVRENILHFAGWQLDLVRRELKSAKNVVIELSAGEYDLLLAFLEHPQRVLSRDQLLDLTRNRVSSPYDRSIDVQVSRLRRKLEVDPPEVPLIKTVRGTGYIFASEVKRL